MCIYYERVYVNYIICMCVCTNIPWGSRSGSAGAGGSRPIVTSGSLTPIFVYVCIYIHNLFYPSVWYTCIVSLTPMLVYACVHVFYLSMLVSVYVSAQGLGFRV
jgi:hypothetical protein